MAERVLRQIESVAPDIAAARQILLRGVSKDFDLGKVVVPALRDIDLEIRENEFLAITGPSGSGKTTLLNLIGCLDQPTAGSIQIDGEDVTTMKPKELARLRSRKLGLVFQSFNLIPVLTVGENVEYPLLIRERGGDAKERKRRVRDLLEQLEIAALENRFPNKLSGGQCQRVAVARALIGEPRIVIADEPTSNLDSQTGAALLRMMKRLHEQKRITFIFSTHDANIVRLAERVVELRDGHIVADD